MSDRNEEYRIDLDVYSGPLDLLLFLIRRDEIDIYDIPIARVTEQYVQYLDVLAELNINVAGEFLVMAATLMEIKSRMMAPMPEPMPEDENQEDPRLELVRQLMEYKRFKEAALALAECADERAERVPRAGERGAHDEARPEGVPQGVTLWGLLEAFSRVLKQTGARGPHLIVLDDIPQEQLRQDLEAAVRAGGRMAFRDAFEGQADRARLIGMFLALLELIRRQVIRVEQQETFGEIFLAYAPEHQRPAPDASPADSHAQDAPPEQDEDPLAEPHELPDEDAPITLPDVPDIDATAP
jgi:segregation and condensation protein A